MASISSMPGSAPTVAPGIAACCSLCEASCDKGAIMLRPPKNVDGLASGAASSGVTQQLTVKSMDTMKFDPTTLTAKAGQPIQMTLDNSSGQIAHDFDITEGVPQPIKVSAQPGQKATGTFTVDKPGSY